MMQRWHFHLHKALGGNTAEGVDARLPGQSVFDDLVPEVKRFLDEVLKVRTSRLAEASIQCRHAVYCSYGLPDAAGHQTLLNYSTAENFDTLLFCQITTDTKSLREHDYSLFTHLYHLHPLTVVYST